MSTSTVPIFDPSGILRDVPYEQMLEAVKAGGKPGVRFQAPDGKVRYVPADQTKDAAAAGGKMLPIEQQDKGIPEWYGFTPSNIAKNFYQGAKSVVSGAADIAKDLASNPNWVEGDESTLRKFVEKPLEAESAKAVEEWRAGHPVVAAGHALAGGMPLVGPAAANIGEQLGSGDVGGALGQVAGQAATIYAGPKLAKAAVKIAPSAAGAILEHTPVVGPAIRIGKALHQGLTSAADALEAPAEAEMQVPATARLLKKSERPLGPIRGRMDATTAQQAEALRQPVHDVVDQHIPPEVNHADNLATKAKVEFHLKRGDVAGAEAELDQAAAKVNPDYKPPAREQGAPLTEDEQFQKATETANEALKEGERRHPELNIDYQGPERRALAAQGPVEYGLNPQPAEDLGNKVREGTEKKFGPIKRAKKVTPVQQAAPLANLPPHIAESLPEHMRSEAPPQIVPAVQNIRENIAMQRAAEAGPGPRRIDLMEDKGIIERMRQNLEEHGSRAESEARREFIARNSTGITKGQLTGQVPMEEGTLTEEWQRALDDIRKRRQSEQ
jgi:hypothetical protein